jgi:hypothetical protein
VLFSLAVGLCRSIAFLVALVSIPVSLVSILTKRLLQAIGLLKRDPRIKNWGFRREFVNVGSGLALNAPLFTVEGAEFDLVSRL